MGELFPTKVEPAMAVYLMFRSFGHILGFGYAHFMCMSIKIYITGGKCDNIVLSYHSYTNNSLFTCSFHIMCLYVLLPYCDVRYDIRKKTMFNSSLPPVVFRRAHVLFTLFTWNYWVQNMSRHMAMKIHVLAWNRYKYSHHHA
jgi:hypothetical protein